MDGFDAIARLGFDIEEIEEEEEELVRPFTAEEKAASSDATFYKLTHAIVYCERLKANVEEMSMGDAKAKKLLAHALLDVHGIELNTSDAVAAAGIDVARMKDAHVAAQRAEAHFVTLKVGADMSRAQRVASRLLDTLHAARVGKAC